MFSARPACLAGYKLYVDMVGGAIGQGACAALRRGNKVYQMEDDMPFIHFLSEAEVSLITGCTLDLWKKIVHGCVSVCVIHMCLCLMHVYLC